MNKVSITLVTIGIGLIIGSFLIMIFLHPPESCTIPTGFRDQLFLLITAIPFVVGVMLTALGFITRYDEVD